MTTLDQWATQWGIPPQAVEDLRARMGAIDDGSYPRIQGRSETYVQSVVRLEASKRGERLWRNNVGACQDKTGRVIRYGLCNESKAMNGAIKSADLVGIKPVVITPDMVGHVIGQFLARETKCEGWVYKGDAHEEAQLKWLDLVNSLGGDAAFTTGIDNSVNK